MYLSGPTQNDYGTTFWTLEALSTEHDKHIKLSIGLLATKEGLTVGNGEAVIPWSDLEAAKVHAQSHGDNDGR